MRADLGVRAATLAVAAAFGLTLVPGLAGVPALIGSLMLVLVLPGLLLSFVLFSGDDLSGPERLFISLGSSVALAAFTGLVLNLFRPLSAENWRLALGVVCVILLIAAAARTRAPHGPRPTAALWPPRASTTHLIAAGTVAVLICAVAVWLSRASAERVPSPGFTELSLLRADEEGSADLQLRVRSREAEPIDFELRVDGLAGTRQWQFTLEPGEQFTRALIAPEDATVVARLSRPDEGGIYRRVELKPPVSADAN